MDGTLIATTRNANLQSLGTGGQRAVHIWGQIVGYVQRRFGPAHAALFAEPNPDPDRGTIDWYAEQSGEVQLLDSLPEIERVAARAQLDRLQRELGAESERLRKSAHEDERFLGEMLGFALVTPSADHLYVVDGQPVLVAWGHTLIGETARPELLIGQRTLGARQRAGTSAAAGNSGKSAPMVIHGPPPAQRQFPVGLLASALLSLAILALVPVLVFKDPFGWFGLPPPQCTVPPTELALQEELRNEQRREGRMRSEIAKASLALGDRRAACPPVQAPPPAVPADVTEAQRRADAQRVQREGGKSGRIQVILAWDDNSDLDLAILCPDGGKIDFDTPSSCGGTLDVDRNATAPTTNPVENVVFVREPPAGRYQIFVTHFKLGPSAPPSTTYRVTVRMEGQPDRSYTGTVAARQRVPVAHFDVPTQR